MTVLAAVLISALASAAGGGAGPAEPPPAPDAPALPAGPIELADHPRRLAVLPSADGPLEVLLQRQGVVERYRLRGRRLEPAGSFRSPARRARALHLDATPGPDGGALVAALFGDDVRSTDEGTDTQLHAWLLRAEPGGALRAVSGDLEASLRLLGGAAYAQRRGPGRLHDGPVVAVEAAPGGFALGARSVPWAGRWLLEATPLPGGAEALAWERGQPLLVALDGGARVPGGVLLGDLGSVGEPQIAVRLPQPSYLLGADKEARQADAWHAVPRRVLLGPAGVAYTIDRQRSGGVAIFGRRSGQDSVVRLETSGGGLSLSRPFPGVEAFLLDFAIIEQAGRPPAALLLLNESEDGSGRAYLLFQEAR